MIEIIDIRDATPEEIEAWNREHGDGGGVYGK
jgi:hypothetical protein